MGNRIETLWNIYNSSSLLKQNFDFASLVHLLTDKDLSFLDEETTENDKQIALQNFLLRVLRDPAFRVRNFAGGPLEIYCGITTSIWVHSEKDARESLVNVTCEVPQLIATFESLVKAGFRIEDVLIHRNTPQHVRLVESILRFACDVHRFSYTG
jgi:hypothetical protein